MESSDSLKIKNIQDDSKLDVYQEKLLKINNVERDTISKSYPVEILSKRKMLVKSTFSIDYHNREIILTTNDFLNISIKFIDLLALVPLTDRETSEYKENIKKNTKTFDIEESLFGKKIAFLNFFPLFSVKKCNCCGWICCSCKETITERRPKNLEILIKLTEIEEVYFEVNKICLIESGVMYKELDGNKKRRLLLFVNPVGGQGSALGIWNRIKNLFSISNLDIEVFRTQHYHHAYEHTLDMDFKKYNGVLCCSGDGIVHEVVNAIFHREDKDAFMQSCPIGVIPGGTSNGFAKSICDASNEQCLAENCAFIISKGQVRDVDIMELETLSEERKIYAFLSVAWGIIADIDLESESCRCCGSMRYSVYGALRWICLRDTFAALYYLPQDSNVSLDTIPSLKDSLNEEDHRLECVRENDQFSYFWTCNVAYTGESIFCAPKAKIDDGYCDILKMKRSAGKLNLLKQLFNQDTGDYYDQKGDIKQGSGLEYIKSKFWRLIPKNNLQEDDDSRINRNLNKFYSIDGERYPIEPIQVKVIRKALRVFCFSK